MMKTPLAVLCATDRNGWTALHAACFAKCDEIVLRLLKETHVDVAAKNGPCVCVRAFMFADDSFMHDMVH